MIEVLYDDNGDIKAVIGYIVFDKEGKLGEHGTYMFIEFFEVSKQHRDNGVIKELQLRLGKKHPFVEQVGYYRHNKYPGRGMKLINAGKFRRS